MSNYIVTERTEVFNEIAKYNYCSLEEMLLPEKIAVDSETDGLLFYKNNMFCLQIGTGINNYIIDLETIDFKLVIPFLKDKTMVFVNAVFDLKFFYKNQFFPDKVRDAMIASQILYNGDEKIFTHGFKDMMKRELGVEYDKTEQKNIHKVKLGTKEAIQYSFNDVDRLLELEELLYNKLVEYDAQKAYLFNCEFLKTQTYIEMCGLPISKEKWDEKSKQDEINSARAQRQIQDYIYDNLPEFRDIQIDMFDTSKKISCLLSSPSQMIKVFKKLKINTWDEKEEKDSVSEAIISKTKHEFVDMWLKYKEAEHRVTTFGQSISGNIIDGYLYSNFRTIADTGRMISRAGNINFLNFPRDKETRICFEAHKGYKMLGCDYDSQESRVLAYKTQDINSKLNVLQDRDAHSLLAREAFPELKELSDSEIKKNHGDKRQIGKVINFAASFGATGYTIATQLGLALDEGDRLYNVYKELYADVFEWGKKILEQGVKKGWIESEEGFKIKLPNYRRFKELEVLNKDIDWTSYRKGKTEFKAKQEADRAKESYSVSDVKNYEYYKKHYKNVSRFFQIKSSWTNLCLNFPIQSCASFQSKKACIDLFNTILKNNHQWQVRMSNFIYDEIIVECKNELSDQYRIILEDCMKNAANYYVNYDKEIVMSCTANVGDTWYSVK